MERLVVPATLDSLSAIGRFVMEAAAAAGLNKHAAYRLRLAVDEIATNSINYGYADVPSPPPLKLFAQWDERALKVTLEDQAPPYDPRQKPPPEDLDLPPEERRIGGLGIFLAEHGVDQFLYERVDDRNRNIFIMNRTPESTEPRTTS